MGYMRHHAIVVADHGDTRGSLRKAHDEATDLFPWVSPISDAAMNGCRSFFIPPDGSKEGWSESDVGDARRSQFLAMLEAYRYSDGSSPLQWVEVQFGDDNGVSIVTHHSDEK